MKRKTKYRSCKGCGKETDAHEFCPICATKKLLGKRLPKEKMDLNLQPKKVKPDSYVETRLAMFIEVIAEPGLDEDEVCRKLRILIDRVWTEGFNDGIQAEKENADV